MDLKSIMMFALLTSIGVFVLVSYYMKLDWYMDNYQSRPMREQWGERAFAIYTHVICLFIIVLGANGVVKELF